MSNIDFKGVITIDKHEIKLLLGYVTELFEKTNTLYATTLKAPDKTSPLVTTYISEIFTLSEKAKLYVDMNENLAHYEISTLFSLFDHLYFQLKDVIKKKDRNTSWLVSDFDNYKAQHEIVVQMLKEITA